MHYDIITGSHNRIAPVRVKHRVPDVSHSQWEPPTVLTPPPCVLQHAAIHAPPAHRQALHPQEGEHGDGQLHEPGHEGAAEQVESSDRAA